jgi:hypothetical protein
MQHARACVDTNRGTCIARTDMPLHACVPAGGHHRRAVQAGVGALQDHAAARGLPASRRGL